MLGNPVHLIKVEWDVIRAKKIEVYEAKTMRHSRGRQFENNLFKIGQIL